MTSLTMRGRYLMREYWADSELHMKLSAEEREFYVGLWMLADDEGWLPRNVPEIAGALMRFSDREPREAKTRLALRRLSAMGKLTSLRCGCLHVPAVTKYPRAGKKSDEHYRNHLNHPRNSNGIQTDLNGFEPLTPNPIQTDLNPSPVPSLPDLTRPSRARTREESEPDEYGKLVAAHTARRLGFKEPTP